MTFPIGLAIVTVALLWFYRIQTTHATKLRGQIQGGGQFTRGMAMVVLNKQGRFVMVCAVTLAVLGSAIYIILSKAFDESSEKWAFGAVGTVLGFWLRPEK